MRPYPADRIGLAASRHASHVPTTLTSRHAQRPDGEQIKRAACLHPGAGDQYIEATMVSEHTVDQSGDIGFVGDVASAAGNLPPGLRRHTGSGLLAALGRAAGKYHVRARRSHRGRDRQTKPTRPTSHERYLTGA
jgi:hypothetical protein